MRVEATLKKWNDDRGFGFASSSQDDSEVFVHISAFPRDGMRPRVGERLSFEVDVGSDGKRRAINLVCLDRQLAYAPPASRTPPRRERRSRLAGVLPMVVVLALGAYGYAEYSRRTSGRPTFDDQSETRSSPRTYQCDGRTLCPQMTSCAEATFFLRNCPNVRMDGNNDGIPCEQQWCGG